MIFLFVGFKGFPIFQKVDLLEFLFGTNWIPSKGKFEIFPFIVGSFLVTLGALLIGTPLALATAIFLAEIAPLKAKKIIRPAVELLAGIPSVIYGFFGIVILVPIVSKIFGGSGFSLATGWIVLAIMILPTITTISEDAISSVPKGFKMSSMALGATHWQTIWKIILPAASQGIITAIILGLGRAVGETMAVLMVLGNSPVIPTSLKDGVSTLTSIIALDMSYASGDHQVALFSMGLVLLLISMLLVAFVRFFSLRKRA